MWHLVLTFLLVNAVMYSPLLKKEIALNLANGMPEDCYLGGQVCNVLLHFSLPGKLLQQPQPGKHFGRRLQARAPSLGHLQLYIVRRLT